MLYLTRSRTCTVRAHIRDRTAHIVLYPPKHRMFLSLGAGFGNRSYDLQYGRDDPSCSEEGELVLGTQGGHVACETEIM